MRFPLLEQLSLPCVFEQLVPGRLHPDGQRYLPQILLRPTAGVELLPPGLLLSVVDRHHRVEQGDVGRSGSARIICTLSAVRLQAPPFRRGLVPEAGWRDGPSASPEVLGRVIEVAVWEATRGELPYVSLYTELSLDIGIGLVGLRTSLTASDPAAAIGKAPIEPGDYLALARSRIDILGFQAE